MDKFLQVICDGDDELTNNLDYCLARWGVSEISTITEKSKQLGIHIFIMIRPYIVTNLIYDPRWTKVFVTKFEKYLTDHPGQ